jgi:DNA-binding transcriptional regulator YiaG
MCSKRAIDPEKLAALARYNAATGHTDDPKVTNLKAPRARATKPPPAPRKKKMTALEYRDSVLAMYKLQHLKKAEDVPAYDVTKATRYPAAPMSTRIGDERLQSILKRFEWVMKPQGISGAELKSWREHSMYMTTEQLATLVRVTDRTIRNWENGTSEIPFSMWWMMHTTLQDPDYFLTRPGFHDFYIDFDRHTGEPALCSYTWPDIRATPTNLYFNQAALSKVGQLQYALERKEKALAELTAENTRLRQMLKAGTVANELTAMHEHIGNLLKQMHTADIVSFPESASTSEVIEFPRQATA